MPVRANTPIQARPKRGGELALLGLLALAGPARAGEDAISPDRPGLVESSMTVGKGRFQIETSVNAERDKAEGVRVKSTSSPTLLRYGLADDLELRLGGDGFVRQRQEGGGATETAHGFGDVTLGLKWHSHDGNPQTGAPSVAWLFHVDTPSGSGPFRGHGPRPSLRGTAEWELPGDFSFGALAGLASETDEAKDRFVSGILGVVLGNAWTERLRTFVEVAGERLTSARHGGPQVKYGLGATYLVSDAMQLDIAYGHAANRYTPDHALTIGLSLKF